MEKGKIIGVVNSKGGSGKTTISFILSTELARRGFKVLAVDFDRQASLTYLMGLNPKQFIGTESDITRIKEGKDVKPVNIRENIDLVPANIGLREIAESAMDGRVFLLKKFLRGDILTEFEGLVDKYDFVIVDTEGTAGTLETSVEIAADYIITPLRPNILDETGSKAFIETLFTNIVTFELKNLQFVGFVAVDFNLREKIPLARYKFLKENLPKELMPIAKKLKYAGFKFLDEEKLNNLFLPEIPRRAVVDKAFTKRIPIQEYIQTYKESMDLLDRIEILTDEVLDRIGASIKI